MTVTVSIKANTQEMADKLNNLVRRQIPFAVTKTTTQTATVTRDDYVLREYRRDFTSRNKQFEKLAHSVAAADVKHTRQTGVAIAAIMPRDGKRPQGTTRAAMPKKLDTSFMTRQRKGGIKMPKGGKNIAIPISGSPITRRTSGAKAGAIRKNFEPKTLMQNFPEKTFIKKNSRGNKIMYRKVGRGNKIQPMYLLKPTTNIKRRHNPLPEAQRGVMFHFPRLFKRNLILALKTAKLR